MFPNVISRLSADSSTYLGVRAASLSAVSELAGQFTRVQRLRVDGGESTFYIFVKLFTPTSTAHDEEARQRRYLAAEYERTLEAALALQQTPSLSVPRVIAYFPDLFALVTREAPGERLDRLLKRFAVIRTAAAKERLCRALGRVGEWVRRFQAGVPVRDPLSRKDYAAYADERLRALVAAGAGGFRERHRTAVRSAVEAHLTLIPADDLAAVAVHADLCPANILVRDDGVTVLDLAMSTDRTRYLDLAHLHFHLSLAARRLRLGSDLARTLQGALLHGYDPHLRADEPLFRLMLTQHVVCHLAGQCDRAAVHPALRDWRMRGHIARGFALAGVALR
jgi:Ser/Thr protein kinase RdoA (MazF antagonist)